MSEPSGDNMLKIFVGNLPFSSTNEDLLNLFSQFGEIQGINIRKDPKTHNPRGFAFITFTSEDYAREAIAGSLSLGGRALTISAATLRGTTSDVKSPSEDDSWKTAPPPSKSKSAIKSSSSNGSGSSGRGPSAKQGAQRRTWDEWAGPVAKKT